MRCKCGTEIDNVPEHLMDLVTWTCAKCANTSPKSEQQIIEHVEDKPLSRREENRPQRAA